MLAKPSTQQPFDTLIRKIDSFWSYNPLVLTDMQDAVTFKLFGSHRPYFPTVFPPGLWSLPSRHHPNNMVSIPVFKGTRYVSLPRGGLRAGRNCREPELDRNHLRTSTPPQAPFSGLLTCGECDEGFTVVAEAYYEDVSGRASDELHNLIETVVVNWDADAKYHELELRGNLLAMLNAARPAVEAGLAECESSLKLVAGVGFEPTTFRL